MDRGETYSAKESSLDASRAFGERLRQLREARGFGQVKLARMLGVAVSELRLWESGAGSGGKKHLREIGHALGVSVKRLRPDKVRVSPPLPVEGNLEFAKRLRLFREAKSLSKERLAHLLGVSPMAIYHWENAANRARPTRVEQLAKILGVTPNDLYGFGPDDPEQRHEQAMALAEQLRRATAADRQRVEAETLAKRVVQGQGFHDLQRQFHLDASKFFAAWLASQNPDRQSA